MKKLICIRNLFTMSLIFLNVCAAAQEIMWQNTIGGSSDDFLMSMAGTSDGGVICGGYSNSNSSGEKTENNQGGIDYWVVKLDSNGMLQWQQTAGGLLTDYLVSIAPTPDNGYICGGSSNSPVSGDKTEDSLGLADFWIIKLDSAGNIQWQKTIGGSANDRLSSVCPAPDGGYICGGSSNSGISGNKTEVNYGLDDYWVVKLDSAGNIQWQKTFGGTSYDNLKTVAPSDGGYICAGSSRSAVSGNKSEGCWGSFDYWILKLDAWGNIQYQNVIGGSDTDELNSIKATSDGGYICGGSSFSGISGDKTTPVFGISDYWVVKINAAGTVQWQNSFGGKLTEELQEVIPVAQGGYLCGGWSNSNISGNKTENSNGEFDYWVVRLDQAGNIMWQNTIRGTNYDYLSSVFQDKNGDFVCGGSSVSDYSDDKKENCAGGMDYWIVSQTNRYNVANGKIFIDLNSNQLQDSAEYSGSCKLITAIPGERISFTRQDGIFNLSLTDSGSITILPPVIPWYTPSPAIHTAHFTGKGQQDSLNDFAFQPAGLFNDLYVQLTPFGNFRSNSTAWYQFNYGNLGTTSLNGTVIFHFDSHLSYVSSSVTPTLVTADSVVWNTGLLAPFQTGSLMLTVHIHSGLPMGTLIYPTVHIDPVIGDAAPQNNDDAWEMYTIASFDPNDVIVNPDTLFTSQVFNSPFLDYIIRFQNTGNDTAFTVRIVNPVDTNKLDIGTLEFISSSHPVNMNYILWESNMEFRFDNILLPDSNINEAMSHGYVRYRIRIKPALQAGDVIKNYAAIYFDYNLPVVTKKAKTRILLPTTAVQGTGGDFQPVVFPNPAEDWLIVKQGWLPRNGQGELKLMDSFGRIRYSCPIPNSSADVGIDISGLANGLYMVQLETGKQLMRAKFVKQ